MIPELGNIIGNDGGCITGRKVLVVEKGSDAGFVLHHHIASYLKQDYNVVLALFTQSFTHYNSIGNKLSVSLAKAKESGNLAVIDCMKEMGDLIVSAGQSPDNDASDPVIVNFNAEKGQCLKGMFLRIKAVYEKLIKNSKPTLILLDDVSVLLDMGVPGSEVYFLVQYLGSLLESGDAGLLLGMHCGKDDDEAHTLSKLLGHAATTIAEVEGLATGYCKDVHGQITVQDNSGKHYKKMQFRLQDKAVAFFAVGTSGAVL